MKYRDLSKGSKEFARNFCKKQLELIDTEIINCSDPKRLQELEAMRLNYEEPEGSASITSEKVH